MGERTRLRPPVAPDAGVTLAEIMVSMGVMSVVMAVVTTAIIQMYQASNRTDLLSGAMAQLQIAYQELDRSVRYATAISDPSTTVSPAGDWYVEWTTTLAGAETCNQLRVDAASGTLQRRSQPDGGVLTAWSVMASFLIGTTQPFTLQPASTSGYPHQRLTVDLTVRPTADTTQPARRSAFSYTSLNTTLTTVSTGVCSAMGRP